MPKTKSTRAKPPAKAARGPRGRTGAVGATGPIGPTGPAGAAGQDYSGDIAALTQQVGELVRELQTQLVRIGQLQAQLDRFAAERDPERRNRRRTD